MHKKTIRTLIGISSVCSLSAAITPFSESFSYPNGNLVGNGTWATHSGTALPVQVTSGAIILAQGAGGREDVNRSFGALAADDVIFASFTFSVTGGPAVTSTYFAHFRSTSDFRSRIYVSAITGGDYTLAFGHDQVEETSTTVLTYGTTYTAVTYFDFNTGEAVLWINPTSTLSPAIFTSFISTTAITSFAFRQGPGNTTQTIDNLIVGTSFASVIPEPSSTAALAGMFALAGVMLRRRRRESLNLQS